MKIKYQLSNANISAAERLLNFKIQSSVYQPLQLREFEDLLYQALIPFIVTNKYENVFFDVNIDVLESSTLIDTLAEMLN